MTLRKHALLPKIAGTAALFLLCLSVAFGQPIQQPDLSDPPETWNLPINSNGPKHIISFSKPFQISVNRGNLLPGDWIGIFALTDLGYRCVGKVKYLDFLHPVSACTVLGRNPSVPFPAPGMLPGRPFIIRIWRPDPSGIGGCVFRHTKIHYLPRIIGGNPQLPNSDSTFVDGGKSTIDSLSAGVYSLRYKNEKELYVCQSSPDTLKPTHRAAPDDSLNFYSDSPAGRLVMNTRNGYIIPARSLPGTYHIKILQRGRLRIGFGNSCLDDTASRITVHIYSSDFALPHDSAFCPAGFRPVRLKPLFSGPELPPNPDYQWAKGQLILSADPEYTATDTGVYFCTVFSDNCSNTESVRFSYLPPLHTPQFRLKYTGCEKALLTARTLDPDVTFLWSDGSTDSTVSITGSTSVTLTLTDSKGCYVTAGYATSLTSLDISGMLPEQVSASPSCKTGGGLTVSLASVKGGVPPYSVRLEYEGSVKENVAPFYLSTFANLKDGLYNLYIRDSNGCEQPYKPQIVIRRDETCRPDLLSPNSDGQEDTYYLPDVGTVKIFNRNGVKIKELTAPAFWDGTDNTGQLVPMGLYVIVTEGRKIEVTVVR